MSEKPNGECCPRFNPEPWDEKELVWRDRLFVKDRVRSIFHIPLNFGAVMKRNMERIEKAGAMPDPPFMLCDENSLWGSDVYIEATKDVPGAEMSVISGTFLSKVFEGPYKNVGKWIAEMKEQAAADGKEIKKLYIYYTTCPRCVKKYGENYVVVLGEV